MKNSQIALALLLTSALAGCTSPEQRFRVQAQQMRRRILLSKGSASEPAITRTGTAFSATWDVRSDLKPDVLESRLTEILKPDFARTNNETERLYYAKYNDGESDRIEVTVSPDENHTIAH